VDTYITIILYKYCSDIALFLYMFRVIVSTFLLHMVYIYKNTGKLYIIVYILFILRVLVLNFMLPECEPNFSKVTSIT
jgi:hypothetical protein